MEELLSPARRAPISNRLQSPTSTCLVGPNDDELERAEARAAARAAALRKPVTAAPQPSASADHGLSKDQITELYRNCIKLAAENKINQKNTWELKLIDHISEIIKVDTEKGDPETNFQKASCTLEAGVKIYAVRVDAVHSKAYKVLAGINRVGLEDEQELISHGGTVNKETTKFKKEETETKIFVLSTLESSFEALNLKKFDVAFLVDPLYHQTTAHLDEGGAEGLLLNSLGVYGDCSVLFDSFEVPGKSKSCAFQGNIADVIDISFAKESTEKMVMNMWVKTEISPSLKAIVGYFGKDGQRLSEVFDSEVDFGIRTDACDVNERVLDDGTVCNQETRFFDNDDASSVVNRKSSFDHPFHGFTMDNDSGASNEHEFSDGVEDIAECLLQGLGLHSKRNAWAGPDHWKYQKTEGPKTIPDIEDGLALTAKKSTRKDPTEVEFDFTKALENETPDAFAPPKNPKSLLLPTNRAHCGNMLPEDCHYQPEDLVKLFLLPNVLCLGKLGFRKRPSAGQSSWQPNDDSGEALPSWDNESIVSYQENDGCFEDDLGNSDGLVSLPRQVIGLDVQYAKTSKHVDVHALKETLWGHMQHSLEDPKVMREDTLSFRLLLDSFTISSQAAAAAVDVSPHLCFICLLHLANEHGLRIRDCSTLDDLSIKFPSSTQRRVGELVEPQF